MDMIFSLTLNLDPFSLASHNFLCFAMIPKSLLVTGCLADYLIFEDSGMFL